MKDIANFIAGFRRFQEKYFSEDRDLFDRLRLGQRPKTLIVACSDSRVDPVMLTGSQRLRADRGRFLRPAGEPTIEFRRRHQDLIANMDIPDWK